MDMAIVVVIILSSFFLGRLSVFPGNKKFLKLKSELEIMTSSRDYWRKKHLLHVMRAKTKELQEKNSRPLED